MTAWRRGAKPHGWYPRRGEVCVVGLDKERHAIILSSNSINAHSLDVCIIPISTAEHRAFSLRPKLAARDGGLARESWAKCDQPTTVEKSQVIYPPIGMLSAEAMKRVEDAVRAGLELG